MTDIAVRPTRLADGRELIYFDDAGSTLPPERRADPRHLDPRPPTATMRLDLLTGDWVSIASARQNRAFLPPAEFDPLAPQSDTNPSEVPAQYDVAVFENRSPSFGPALGDAEDAPEGLADLASLAVGRTRTSVGRTEVVCFDPGTHGSFADLTANRARTVVEAWTQRTAALSALDGVQQVFPFENRGEAIGVTLHHPHGQIYAYPYVTPRTSALLRQVDAYEGDLFADLLAFEQAGDRVVLRSETFTAFVPFAARWPVELHLLPHRHVADFTELTDPERDELARVYLRLLRAIDALYETPTPYIAAWHQAPVATHRDRVRLNLQISSPRRGPERLKYLAGSEAAMGAWIGDLVPERTAEQLRAALEKADAERPL
ncbi:galactose-1-phosphate uridylyltransferase [uncultured Amnibacterium sp.]|uniref:galactose-1-phosphate uridylyltransferase n=1 Tax=uncultured Amnibacterium sp. TaxID=1631851 RepID=UPI0035C969EC